MQTAIERIRELRALHDDGLLDQDEYERRRNAILDAPHEAATPAAGGTELGLMAGQHVGPPDRRYRLERFVAPGAMSQVWQATDLATHAELGHSAQVALKILAPEPAGGSGYARLLVQEATRARRLAHEHIVRVYDWAQDPATGSVFLIMEWLDGEDLDSLLARTGALPPARVLELLGPVAKALDHAWDRHGLVHRDIKPANVFVTTRGEVKLLDFGIAARARAGTAPPGGSAIDAPAQSGTPGYRAPEAAIPGLVPARTLDVYAVARMSAQMLTGVPPGASPSAPPGALAEDTPCPAEVVPTLWQVLREGWAADPARRPRSVSALLDKLRAELASPAAPGAPEDPPPGSPQAPAGARMEQPAEAPPEGPSAVAPPLARPPSPALAPLPVVELTGAGLAGAEQVRRERVEAQAMRAARREALSAQLAARREAELARVRALREETQTRLLHARAATAYLAEQERVRAEEGAAVPPVAAPTAATGPGAAPALLRDRFLDADATGPELVVVRAGRFQMGSPEHERARALAEGTRAHWLARETPQRWVGIERPFALGRTSVTVGEWRAFVEATGWQGSGDVDWAAPGFPQTELHPVVGVSWHDARHYLAWLGERTGRHYRLPSEAEWEYACRAGTRSAFSCGDRIDTGLANYNGNFSWNGGEPGVFRRGTTRVAAFPPNPWGLHDMHGNVWEWVQDVLHDSYEGAPGDGSAWEDGGEHGGAESRRVLRGGCWRYHPRYLRSALRNGFSAAMASNVVGFRVARGLSDAECEAMSGPG